MIAGYGTRDGVNIPVIDGKEIFKLMDTHGLDIGMIKSLLAEKGLAFDVLGFCKAAKKSKNYTQDRLKLILTLENVAPIELIDKTIEVAYNEL